MSSRSKSQDVRRQLFLGITKKMRTNNNGNQSQKSNNDVVNDLASNHFESSPQTLQQSSNVAKSPFSIKSSQRVYTPSSSTLNSNTNNNNESVDTTTSSNFSAKYVLLKKGDQFDYSCFSDQPLRTAKVNAIEQAEITTHLLFNSDSEETLKEYEEDDDDNDNDEVIVAFPGMGRDQTKIELAKMDTLNIDSSKKYKSAKSELSSSSSADSSCSSTSRLLSNLKLNNIKFLKDFDEEQLIKFFHIQEQESHEMERLRGYKYSQTNSKNNDDDLMEKLRSYIVED
ncbi:hypothetical protein PACTADRAFT_50390 [Pachysolen tannophilus NRRL Y-2460]|uniref:Uncharacterized protein n=1 Tax=Pachysolen tannophilus NRRL Y-2460 TaxID=669874 RepID=A0A1E4TVF7_PACTA|nr:hypothetical protein PACTADRAFT_50390 [Pachysolen tannophilus NRRL Y-2460]